ncbi:MAG: thermonuclease family protein [Pseudobacter sp.]|uniref:thermonuclease family protein n=1 Tax=Pseudobacter sp. TaxID=2045420 RepID=UPI003F7E1AC7
MSVKTNISALVCFCMLHLTACDFSGNLELASKSDHTGRVIRIVDGDTFELLTSSNQTIRVRMAGIDAPERGQPYYQKSKDFLATLCFQKEVSLKKVSRDRYSRIIAWTYINENISLSHEMVKNGFAWHFIKYDNSPKLDTLESKARHEKAGLWADENPVAPWLHRRSRNRVQR